MHFQETFIWYNSEVVGKTLSWIFVEFPSIIMQNFGSIGQLLRVFMIKFKFILTLGVKFWDEDEADDFGGVLRYYRHLP
jgi:hypothetical protein